jgi:hypothetical protein
MYASTVDRVRSGICNAAPSHVGYRQRCEDYAESAPLM